MYLAAQQQDWRIDGVKVAFHTQPGRNAQIMQGALADLMGNLRVASDERSSNSRGWSSWTERQVDLLVVP